MNKHIPSGWEEKPLIDLCEKSKRAIVDGPFGSNLKIIHYRKSGVPIITSGYVTDGVFKANEYLYVDEEKFQQEIRSKVQGGDIVMAKIGARCGASAIMPEKHPIGLLSGNALKITVDEKHNSTKYVWYYLDWLNRNGKLAGIKATGAQPAVSVPSLKKLPILRPPHDEQNRIVEILSAWNRAIETLGNLIDAKTMLKKGLMQKVLTGKKRLRGFKEKWQIKKLGDLGSFLKGKGLSKEDVGFSGKVRAVPYTAIYTDFNELITHDQIKTFTSAKDIFVINSPHVLVAGSSNMLENIGKATAYNDRKDVAIGGDVILFKTDSDVRFIAYLLNTKFHRRKIIALSQGVTIRHVYPSTFYNYEIEIPDASEQTAIADMHMAIDKDISLLKQLRDLLNEQKKGLMQKLLTGKIRVKV